MQYNVQRVDQAVVFMLGGKVLNEQQTAAIREKLSHEIAGNQKKFIFDLKDVEFVNSACLNFLVSAKNKITASGGKIILCNVSDQLKKLLNMTRLASFFLVAGRTAEAVALLNQTSQG